MLIITCYVYGGCLMRSRAKLLTLLKPIYSPRLFWWDLRCSVFLVFCVMFFYVVCLRFVFHAQCFLCFWIFHSWLHLWFVSNVYLYYISYASVHWTSTNGTESTKWNSIILRKLQSKLLLYSMFTQY